VTAADLDRILAEPVHTGSGYKPFREMSAAEVETRAEELACAAEVPAMQRMAAVASAWHGLAAAMRTAEAATVADLDRGELESRADRLHVIPPGGSFL
jgi:DNA-directed RNA polymerase specialized sigma24 family protein